MEEMRASLQTLIGCCAGDDRPDCPILADLSEPGQEPPSRPDSLARLRDQSIANRRG
jgi:MerR family gold-responsive transcriptional activator of gol and ges genes